MASAYDVSKPTWGENSSPGDTHDLSTSQGYLEAIASETYNPLNYGKNQQAAINQLQSQAFNSAEARSNREWQEMMSNTAHQREVADLQAAGLNTWLSAGGDGASTPSGGVATSSAMNATDFAGPALIHSLTSIAGSIIGLFGHKGAGKAVKAAGDYLGKSAQSGAQAAAIDDMTSSVAKAVKYGEDQYNKASWQDVWRKGSKKWQAVRESMGYSGSSFIKSD